MLKKILLTILALVVLSVLAVIGLASTKPNTYRVERKLTMAAPPATVFAIVNDFHRWSEWSPWDKLDPAMKKTIEGSGVGSVYSWSGNDQVGEGKMTLTESVPDSRVAMKLEFIKPWAAVNDVEILLAPASDGTEVMWAMNGTHNFLSKAMCVFMDMDQMMGKDFESGLSNLKSLAESAPPVEAAPADSAAASAS